MLLCKRTIHKIITKYKETGCVANLPSRGRKRITSAHTDRIIQRKVKVDRRKSACSVKEEVEKELSVTVSESTVRRRLHEIDLKGRVARKKPYVNKVNREKRLEYARTYQEKPLALWKTVLCSDESKYNLSGSDGKVMVWKTTAEEFDSKCTVPTVKHGGGNVTVWVCFSYPGVGNLVFIESNMDGPMYRDILQENLKLSAKKLKMGRKWVFQHDNDPKHTSKIVTSWPDKERIERLKWPPSSPDMNPIEHLWDEVERRMKKFQPKNAQELKETLTRVWNEIELPVLQKLVDSVLNRLHEVVNMKGYPTRY